MGENASVKKQTKEIKTKKQNFKKIKYLQNFIFFNFDL